MRSPILATVATLAALVGYALSERAQALQAIEGPRWWDSGLTREQAAQEAAYEALTGPARQLHAAQMEPGIPGHDMHLIGLVLIVAGGTVAVAAGIGER